VSVTSLRKFGMKHPKPFFLSLNTQPQLCFRKSRCALINLICFKCDEIVIIVCKACMNDFGFNAFLHCFEHRECIPKIVSACWGDFDAALALAHSSRD